MKIRRWLAIAAAPLVSGVLLYSFIFAFSLLNQNGQTDQGEEVGGAFLFHILLPFLILMGVPFQYFVSVKLLTRWLSGSISSARMYSTYYWHMSCVTIFEILILPAGQNFTQMLHASIFVLIANLFYFTLNYLLSYFIWLRPARKAKLEESVA
jgi:hypothetical protein